MDLVKAANPGDQPLPEGVHNVFQGAGTAESGEVELQNQVTAFKSTGMGMEPGAPEKLIKASPSPDPAIRICQFPDPDPNNQTVLFRSSYCMIPADPPSDLRSSRQE